MPSWASAVPHADPAMPRLRAVHQGDVEGDVGREADQRDDERGAGVLQAAQDAGRGEVEQHERHRQRADPQVGRRVGLHPTGRAEPAGQVGREGEHRQAGAEAEDRGQPQPVDADGERAAMVVGTEPAGDGAGGAVGQEDEDAGHGRERGGRHAERGQLGGAQVTDDDRVGEQEHRLGDEGHERGYGEPEHLAVQGGVRATDRRAGLTTCWTASCISLLHTRWRRLGHRPSTPMSGRAAGALAGGLPPGCPQRCTQGSGRCPQPVEWSSTGARTGVLGHALPAS